MCKSYTTMMLTNLSAWTLADAKNNHAHFWCTLERFCTYWWLPWQHSGMTVILLEIYSHFVGRICLWYFSEDSCVHENVLLRSWWREAIEAKIKHWREWVALIQKWMWKYLLFRSIRVQITHTSNAMHWLKEEHNRNLPHRDEAK